MQLGFDTQAVNDLSDFQFRRQRQCGGLQAAVVGVEGGERINHYNLAGNIVIAAGFPGDIQNGFTAGIGIFCGAGQQFFQHGTRQEFMHTVCAGKENIAGLYIGRAVIYFHLPVHAKRARQVGFIAADAGGVILGQRLQRTVAVLVGTQALDAGVADVKNIGGL